MVSAVVYKTCFLLGGKLPRGFGGDAGFFPGIRPAPEVAVMFFRRRYQPYVRSIAFLKRTLATLASSSDMPMFTAFRLSAVCAETFRKKP